MSRTYDFEFTDRTYRTHGFEFTEYVILYAERHVPSFRIFRKGTWQTDELYEL